MNYKATIEAKSSQQNAFNAISKELNKWWGDTDKPTSKIGDEFTVSFGNANWSFRVTEFVPNTKLTWECIGGNPDFNAEWIGDVLHWNIEEFGENGVRVSLEQIGLTPDKNCYDVCNKGWDFFITKSLKEYLETGVGDLHFVEPK